MNAKLIGLALSGLAVIGTAFYIYTLRVDIKDLKGEVSGLERYLSEATAEVDQCNADKVLTEKVSNDYQKSARSLRNQLNSLRANPRCVPIEPSDKTNGDNGSPAGTKLSGRSGLTTGYLVDLGGRCEETRLKLIGCQTFVNQLYESRKK